MTYLKNRTISQLFLVLAVTFTAVILDSAQAEPNSTQNPQDIIVFLPPQETLTNNWFGLGEKLSEEGITVALSATQVYQQNLRGGLSTHNREGRYEGSYDLEFWFDLDKLFKVPNGLVYILTEGRWSNGLDESSIGSAVGNVNADAAGDLPIVIAEFYYQQIFFDEKLSIRLGKIDLTGGFECAGCPVSFDGNSFANDETSQFLNAALVNNPTIPFPQQGLGVIVHLVPVDGFYLSGGIADAQAHDRETGFNTTFHDEDYFFSVFEVGLTPQIPSSNGPLQGAYRVGLWYDPQSKDFVDGTSRTKHDDVGFYLSFDQVVCKENSNEDDSQGLGIFARYGLADEDVNEIKHFWSVGTQYQGLVPSRDEDVLGFGVAQGILDEKAGYSESQETVMELYYNASVTPWLGVSPSLQYVINPGASDSVKDALVIGLRLQMSF